MSNSSTAPLHPSSLLFSSQSTDFARTLPNLKRSALSIPNRLRSIVSDAAFVASVADAFHLPLVANERCGSWYVPPEKKAGNAYFKSTDGHTGQWSFSLRRLNVQVFEWLDAAENGGRGCVIVDSTRRGKAMPDAFLKTVPIWCAVFNRLLFPEEPEAGTLYTPPNHVSRSEHAQIEQRLDGFVADLKKLKLDVAALRDRVKRPMRPIWITRESELPSEPPQYDDFIPIVLCTASRRVRGAEVSEGGYVQGAGDDAEGWSCGLTPVLFWEHREELLEAREDDISALIEKYLLESENSQGASSIKPLERAPWLAISSFNELTATTISGYDVLITVGRRAEVPELKVPGRRYLHLECRQHKLGSRDLRTQLPILRDHFRNLTSLNDALVACSTGRDLSAGVALALLCLYADDEGLFNSSRTKLNINKDLIKQRLSWIMTGYSIASPSRTTLQSINDFLLTQHDESRKSNDLSMSRLRVTKPHEPTDSSELVFRSLDGNWSLHRTIKNHHIKDLAGTVRGTVTFTVREPTSSLASSEYLYQEQGIFTTSLNIQMPITRNWIWRLLKPDTSVEMSTMHIYFVKADGVTEDYEYNSLGTLSEEKMIEDGETKILVTRAEHPCGRDFYVSTYRFFLNEGQVDRFDVEHEVKGPEKDYVSISVHRREK